jgi:hypothetical protein
MNYSITTRSNDGKKVLIQSLEYPTLAPSWVTADANGNPVETPVFNPPKSAASKAAFYGQVEVTRRKWAEDGRNAANRGGR